MPSLMSHQKGLPVGGGVGGRGGSGVELVQEPPVWLGLLCAAWFLPNIDQRCFSLEMNVAALLDFGNTAHYVCVCLSVCVS